MQLRKIAKNYAVLPPVNVKNREKSEVSVIDAVGADNAAALFRPPEHQLLLGTTTLSSNSISMFKPLGQ